MTQPALDIIVPVHSASRPVRRLADSVLQGSRTALRITFVCHGVTEGAIREALGSAADDPRVRLREFADGLHSPAGPFIAGLEMATAPFVMKIDSDDSLEHDAVDAWMRVQRETGAEIVICRMRSVTSGREWATPPARPGRRRGLDPIRDRLAYRTSTMGIVARHHMLAAPPVTGLPTGEDIESSLRLWFSGASIALASREPAYLVHDDGVDRATAPRSLAAEFAWLERLRESTLRAALSPKARTAIVTKLLRVQLFGAVAVRSESLREDEVGALRDAAIALIGFSDGSPPWLSRADHDLLDEILSPSPDIDALKLRSDLRRRFGHPATLLPRRLRWALHREAPLRVMAATALASRRRTRS